MGLTKLTTQVWSVSPISGGISPELAVERQTYIDAQIVAAKTDGQFTEIDDLTYTRKWSDQAAAEDWKTFIEGLAKKYSTNSDLVITVTISDL